MSATTEASEATAVTEDAEVHEIGRQCVYPGNCGNTEDGRGR